MTESVAAKNVKNVLLITNTTTSKEVALIKASFSESEQNLPIKLILAHVIPSLPIYYFNTPSMVFLVEQYYEEAKQSLSNFGNMLNVPTKDQWIVTGNIRSEVFKLAQKLNIQFILASSTTIQDIHQSLFFTYGQDPTPVKRITQTSFRLK